MTTFGTIHFTVKPNDTYKVNTDGDGFSLIDGKGDLGIAVRFESPIDLWHFAKTIEAQAMKAMTPEAVNA
jgi:hypothetical protein